MKYMQTIIRYELVINEALRFTLMLDTPDEQINEFIRFFLENILDVIKFKFLKIIKRTCDR